MIIGMGGLLLAAAPVFSAEPVLPDPVAFTNSMELGDVRQAEKWLDAGMPPDFLGSRIGSGLMTLVMVGLIMVAAVIMGSGNAAFLSFSTLAPAVAAKFGVPAVTMLLPMQLASSIGRTVSPIAAVLIACAGIAKVSPFVVVKRTSVPMAGALVTALLLNYLLFM